MKEVVQWVLLVIGVALLAMTLLPLTESEAWWIQALTFPRVQISWLIACVVIGLMVLARDRRASWWLGGALVLAFIYQVFQIFPYTPVAPSQTLPATSADSSRRLKLLTANIYMMNREVGPFLQQIERYDPDVLLLCEPDQWWEEKMREIEEEYRYTVKEPLPNTYGMILYSRLPLTGSSVEYIIDDTIPSIHAGITLRTGEVINVHCVHPRPPIPGNDTEERDAELVLVGRRVKGNQRPAIVIGDFNDVAWSETTELFQEVSSTLDPRIGRGTYNTFNANYFFLRFPLDHIFHTDHFRLVRLETLGDINSDHFPMFAELSYEPERRQEQEEPEAEESDHREAQEKLEETERKK